MTEFFESAPQAITDAFGYVLFLAAFVGIVLLLCFALLGSLSVTLVNSFDRKADRRQYLQTHRFDRFRVVSFGKDKFEIFEYIGADSPPYSVLYCNDFRNADKICQILNCDFLGEQYTEKKFLKLDDFYTKRLLKEVSTRNRAEDINNLKDPQKEGERK